MKHSSEKTNTLEEELQANMFHSAEIRENPFLEELSEKLDNEHKNHQTLRKLGIIEDAIRTTYTKIRNHQLSNSRETKAEIDEASKLFEEFVSNLDENILAHEYNELVATTPNYRTEIISQIRPRKGSLMINCRERKTTIEGKIHSIRQSFREARIEIENAPIKLLFKYKSKMDDLIKASRDTSGVYDRNLFTAFENIELNLDNATQDHCVLKSGDEYFGGYLTSVNEKYLQARSKMTGYIRTLRKLKYVTEKEIDYQEETRKKSGFLSKIKKSFLGFCAKAQS